MLVGSFTVKADEISLCDVLQAECNDIMDCLHNVSTEIILMLQRTENFTNIMRCIKTDKKIRTKSYIFYDVTPAGFL